MRTRVVTSAYYEDEKQVPGEDDTGFRKAFRHLLPFLSEHRRRLAICLGLLLGATVLSLAWPWLIQQAIDEPLQAQLERTPEARTFTPLVSYGIAILIIQALNLGLLYLQRIKLESVGQDVMLALKTRLFNHILKLDVSFFDQHPVGRLLSRVESDTESLRLLFTNTVVLVVGDLILMLGIWAVMIWKHPKLALVVLGIFPVISILMVIFHRLTTHRFLEVRKRMADVTATLTEFLHGMSIVQIFHRGEYARQRVYRVNERKFSEDAYVNIAVCIFFNTLFLVEHLKVGLILLLGSVWGVTPGTIILFILLIWKEFEPIARTADQLGSFQKGIAGARRIFSLLDIDPKLEDVPVPQPLPTIQHGIRFDNVWFSYNDDDNWVLEDVSFEIPVGKRVALVGVTGGGKSTIISLLLRLYDPQRGRITVDGIDLRDLSRDELRRRCALVLQDIVLFPGDLLSNITLESPDLSMDQVVRAAETVNVDRLAGRLPKGYRTKVSEKGANFSRGERQLLSFARALVVDPDLLILDEATSSVDPETERTIQQSLRSLMKGRTSLIIAHRLSTILDVDRILVLRAGRIVEQGSHRDLLLQEGYYAKLFHLQFSSENGAICHVG